MGEKVVDKLEITLRENLQHTRLLREMTQEAVAKKLGVQINFMSRIETGERSISAVCLYKLCKIYGVSLDDMYSETWQEEHPLNRPYQERTKRAAKLSMEAVGAIKRVTSDKKHILKL